MSSLKRLLHEGGHSQELTYIGSQSPGMNELIDIFEKEVTCTYRGETYRVRDNGAIFRCARTGKRKRPKDEQWTFGNVNKANGYLRFVSEAVHRIVATAFHGTLPSERHVVDHIDTNRQNNRPENLRWLTRLENILLNHITQARIIYLYGSIDNFLADPSRPINGSLTPNYDWMRTVTKAEAENTRNNLLKMGKTKTLSRGGAIGEWVYAKLYSSQLEVRKEEESIPSLTKNVVQKIWKTPSKFPLCPPEKKEHALLEYHRNLIKGKVFVRDKHKQSTVVDAEIAEETGELFIIGNNPKGIKKWSLVKVFIEDQKFVHESRGTYFRLDGAEKEFTLALGKVWDGGETFDELI